MGIYCSPFQHSSGWGIVLGETIGDVGGFSKVKLAVLGCSCCDLVCFAVFGCLVLRFGEKTVKEET